MLKSRCGGPFLQNICIDKLKPSDRENEHSLIICLLDKSAWMLWTTGNFPRRYLRRNLWWRNT
jgi:hypothetical protein